MKNKLILLLLFTTTNLFISSQITFSQEREHPRFRERINNRFNPQQQFNNQDSSPENRNNLNNRENKKSGLREKFAELNLTEEQKTKLKELRQNKDKGKEKFKEVFEARNSLQKLLKDPNASEQQILSEFEKSSKLMQQAQAERIQNMLKIRKILTPEQLNKFLEMKSEFKDKFKEKRTKKWQE